MTCRERLRLDHPGLSAEEFEDMLRRSCPELYAGRPEYCNPTVNLTACERCWDREVEENTTPNVVKEASPSIKSSGSTTEFETGAHRDAREGKGRCDLLPLDVVSRCINYDKGDTVLDEIRMFQIDGDTKHLYEVLDVFAIKAFDSNRYTMFLEVAKHYAAGAEKYGADNWRRGMPVHIYIDSAIRHYLKWQRGDRDELHNRSFIWNVMCCIWEVDHSKKWRDAIADNCTGG